MNVPPEPPPRRPMNFDLEAAGFDGRAALPETALNALDEQLDSLGCTGLGAWLEIGAGTGQLAQRLATRAEHYLALDDSQAMLERLRARGIGGACPLRADANRGWPVASGSIHVVSMFRVAHLLDASRLEVELGRVCAPGAWLIALNRQRQTDGAQERLRREMRRRLARVRGAERSGMRGRSQHEAVRGLLSRVSGDPGQVLRVASWHTSRRLARMLAVWRAKQGLAGEAIEDAAKQVALDALEAWAQREFGDLQAERQGVEWLELSVFRLPP